jgi:two-component system, NarL family, sensor histidine kinase NreB
MKMYKNSTEAIFFLDNSATILSLNPAAEQIIDPSVLEAIKDGRENTLCSLCRGYMSSEEHQTCSNCYVNQGEGGLTSFQVYLETRDKGVVPFIATYHTIDKENGIHVYMLRDLTLQYKQQEALYRSEMLMKTVEAQENERKRISRELHDSVVQELISVLVDMRLVKYINNYEEIHSRVKQTEESLSRLIEEIRNLSVFLRPASLDDLGLEAAFRSHFKWVEQSYGFHVHFQSTINKKRYPQNIETAVYRICQEAILNAVKYAHVVEVYVTFSERNGKLELIVQDHGEGFNTEKPDIKGSGLGIFGMKERADLIGGQLQIQSEKGKGTTVYLSLPIDKLEEKEVHL